MDTRHKLLLRHTLFRGFFRPFGTDSWQTWQSHWHWFSLAKIFSKDDNARTCLSSTQVITTGREVLLNTESSLLTVLSNTTECYVCVSSLDCCGWNDEPTIRAALATPLWQMHWWQRLDWCCWWCQVWFLLIVASGHLCRDVTKGFKVKLAVGWCRRECVWLSREPIASVLFVLEPHYYLLNTSWRWLTTTVSPKH